MLVAQDLRGSGVAVFTFTLLESTFRHSMGILLLALTFYLEWFDCFSSCLYLDCC